MDKPISLFVCPLPAPYGGQAVISQTVVDFYKPNYIVNINFQNKILGNCRAICQIVFYLLFFNIDLVYFTCTRSKFGAIKDIVLLFLCKFRSVKVINHLHGNEIDDLFNGGFFSTVVAKAYEVIDSTIFVSEMQKDLFPIHLPFMDKVVIPNCYSSLFDDIVFSDKPLNNTNINLLYISFLMESKGVFTALEMFRTLAKEYEGINMHFVGHFHSDEFSSYNEVKNRFLHTFDELNILFPGRIFYHGELSGRDKIDVFVNSDILLFPTFFKSESFGLVIVEAMRAGNAVVTTNFSFIPSIVTPDVGMLFQPQDVRGGCEALKHYLDNVDLLRKVQMENMLISQKLYSEAVFLNRFEAHINSVF